MSEFALRIGSRSAQGMRSNNEDRLLVDLDQKLFLVADGMGGQERGELASGMAVDIIPRAVEKGLAAQSPADQTLLAALHQANQAIIDAGKSQPEGRRMGTTAVCALHRGNQVYITSLGDSRAYLIRQGKVEQLTVDHSVAQALVASGAMTAEEARHSPYSNVLHKFLGCATMNENAEVKPFIPQAGDCMLLATDGLTNHITEEDLQRGPTDYPDPQAWADYLVQTALARGTRDNVTCIVVAFEKS
jgi:serine/threonine protein phosphatase PrpC